ncbi:MAG: hypothetical protein RIE22_05280 [Alphaproteobacteria bacterium]
MKLFAVNGESRSWLIIAETEAAAKSLAAARAEKVFEVLDNVKGDAGIVAEMNAPFVPDIQELTERAA